MNIRIGDYWGAKYDKVKFWPRYARFVLTENIRFVNPNGCRDVVKNRMYEQFEDFLPKKNGLMVDIGCQYGDWSIIAAKKYGSKVIAFEASRENSEIALANVNLNRLLDRISLFNLAVSSFDGELILNYEKGMANQLGQGAKLNVKAITLDSFKFDQQPDLIKIDIEGSELDALQGMKRTLSDYSPRIIIETHTKALLKSCTEFLSSFGYRKKQENPPSVGLGSFDLVQETFWIKDD